MPMNRVQLQSGLSPPDIAHLRHSVPKHTSAPDPLVSGDRPDQSGKNGLVSTDVEAGLGCQLPYRLADASQTHARQGVVRKTRFPSSRQSLSMTMNTLYRSN